MLFLFGWILVWGFVAWLGYMLQNEIINGIGAIMLSLSCTFVV